MSGDGRDPQQAADNASSWFEDLPHELREIYKLILAYLLVIFHGLVGRAEDIDLSVHQDEMNLHISNFASLGSNELVAEFKNLLLRFEDQQIKDILESTLAGATYLMQGGEEVLVALHGALFNTLKLLQSRTDDETIQEVLNAFNTFVTQNERSDLCIEFSINKFEA